MVSGYQTMENEGERSLQIWLNACAIRDYGITTINGCKRISPEIKKTSQIRLSRLMPLNLFGILGSNGPYRLDICVKGVLTYVSTMP